MAQHDLDDTQSAGETLQRSADLLKKLESDDANAGHNDLLISQILHREASRKIAGKAD